MKVLRIETDMAPSFTSFEVIKRRMMEAEIECKAGGEKRIELVFIDPSADMFDAILEKAIIGCSVGDRLDKIEESLRLMINA